MSLPPFNNPFSEGRLNTGTDFRPEWDVPELNRSISDNLANLARLSEIERFSSGTSHSGRKSVPVFRRPSLNGLLNGGRLMGALDHEIDLVLAANGICNLLLADNPPITQGNQPDLPLSPQFLQHRVEHVMLRGGGAETVGNDPSQLVDWNHPMLGVSLALQALKLCEQLFPGQGGERTRLFLVLFVLRFGHSLPGETGRCHQGRQFLAG